MTKSLIVIFVLFLLLSSFSVSAFIFEPVTGGNFCSNQKEIILQFRVLHENETSARYVFSSSHGRLLHKAVTLQKSQQSFIELLLNPINATSITVTAASSDEVMTATVPIIVKDCKPVLVHIEDQIVCSDRQNELSFSFENLRDHAVSAEMEFSHNLDSLNFSIAANSNFTFSMPYISDGKSKTIEVVYLIDGLSEKEQFQIQPVNIQKCSGIAITPITVYTSDPVLIVENKGVKDAAYSFSVVGEDWLSLSLSQATIPAGKAIKLPLSIGAADDIIEEEFLLLAQVENTTYSKTFFVNTGEPNLLKDLWREYWTWFIFSLGIVIVIVAVFLISQRDRSSLSKPAVKSKVVIIKNKSVLGSLDSTMPERKMQEGYWSKKYKKLNFSQPTLDTEFELSLPWSRRQLFLFVLIPIIAILIIAGGMAWISSLPYVSVVLFILAVIAFLLLLFSIFKKAHKSYTEPFQKMSEEKLQKKVVVAKNVEIQERYWTLVRVVSIIVYIVLLGGYVYYGVDLGIWKWVGFAVAVVLLIVLIIVLLPDRVFKNLDQYFFTEQRKL